MLLLLPLELGFCFMTRHLSAPINDQSSAATVRLELLVIRREPTPSAEIASYKRTYQALVAFPTYR